jgi:hypothetical protein
MRDFNEIKAEILRRSDNRIKENKRKRKVYTACALSLCLCVTVALTLFPRLNRIFESETADKAPTYGEPFQNNGASESMDFEYAEGAPDYIVGGNSTVAVSAKLGNGEHSVTLYGKALNQLSSFLNSLDAEGGFEDFDNTSPEEEPTYEMSASEDEVEVSEEFLEDESINDAPVTEDVKVTHIVITYSDGKEVSYKLYGSTLENTDSGEKWVLTDSEYNFLIGFYS